MVIGEGRNHAHSNWLLQELVVAPNTQTTHDKYYFSQLCRSPFGVLMTYLTIQLLYVAGIMYSIVVLRSLVNFFLNYK